MLNLLISCGQEFIDFTGFGAMIDEIQQTYDSIEAGFILLNTTEEKVDENSPGCKAMDQAIEQNMLEFLQDDLTQVEKDNKNTGGLLA